MGTAKSGKMSRLSLKDLLIERRGDGFVVGGISPFGDEEVSFAALGVFHFRVGGRGHEIIELLF